MNGRAYMRIETGEYKPQLTGEHIAMMPLQKNVPEPSARDWTLTTCKACGRACWYMGSNAAVAKAICPSVKFFCTECALKGGTNA